MLERTASRSNKKDPGFTHSSAEYISIILHAMQSSYNKRRLFNENTFNTVDGAWSCSACNTEPVVQLKTIQAVCMCKRGCYVQPLCTKRGNEDVISFCSELHVSAILEV